MGDSGHANGFISVGDMLVSEFSRIRKGRSRLVFGNSVLDTAALAAEVARYAALLNGLGLNPGERVGILARNRLEVAILMLAFPLTNLCRVALHPMGSLDDFAHVVEDAGLTGLIYDPVHYQAQTAELTDRFPQLRNVFSIGPGSVGRDLLAEAAALDAPALQAMPAGATDLIRLAYSGGTTGKPKAIMQSAMGLWATIQIMLSDWEWPSEVRSLIVAPLSHAGGAMLLPIMMRGGTAIIHPGFDAGKVLAAIEEQRITCLLLVPTMIYALLDHPDFDNYDLSSLEIIYYGSSPMSPARLREGIARFGSIFFQFYGQAEAPMTVAVMRRADHDVTDLTRLAACGHPVPWVRVALLDGENTPVPDGQPGEICVQGPLVMIGYLGQPELTAEAFAGGWLHTGDVAVREPDGMLRIVDRKKDMIITGGFNVYPREVEDVLGMHPAVAQSAVVGLPDPRWGEMVVAAVVLHNGANATHDELIALVRERKGPHQAPKRIFFVETIPITGVGKPDKKTVRAMLAQD